MLKKLIILNLLLLPCWLPAQTAEDYFHAGAQRYVFGKKEEAKTAVLTGLQKFPTDSQLRQLLAFFREEEQKKQQQQNKSDEQKQQEKDQQQQQQQQAKNDQKDQKKKKDEQKKKDEPSADEKKDQSDQQRAEDKKGQDTKKGDKNSGKPDDKSKEPQQAEAAYALGHMTMQQAQQLLDAQKNEERTFVFGPLAPPTNSNSRTFKNW